MASVQTQTEISEQALAGWELVSAVLSFAIAEWIATSFSGAVRWVGAVPVILAVLLILFSHRLRKESLSEIGFRFDNFIRAMVLLLMPMLVAFLICYAIARALHSPVDFLRWHPSLPLAVQLGLGFGWGLAQQCVLQGFINRRTQLLFRPGWLSILIVATIFGALHLPNPALTIVTFAGGLVWSAVYQRAPNLFALAVSHCLMTWVVVATIPPSYLHHLRVGFRYFG